MGGFATLIRLWVFHCLTTGICLAASFQTLYANSGLYTFGPGWTNDGNQFTTTDGSVFVSFRGSVFAIPSTGNPSASLTVYVDGKILSSSGLPDGSFSRVNLTAGDHQVMIKARASPSQPYVFLGISVEWASGTTSADYVPQIYGFNASVVPPNTIVMDDTSACVKYSSTGWQRNIDTADQWMNYNNSLARSTEKLAGMTIYFIGTSIWLFSSQAVLQYPRLASVTASIDSGNIEDVPIPSVTDTSISLNQKLFWSRGNLTNTIHVLNLNFTHSELDQMSFDFARVDGSPMDCNLFDATPEVPAGPFDGTLHLTLDTMEIMLMVLISCMFPIIFVGCVCCSRWKRNSITKRYRTMNTNRTKGSNNSSVNSILTHRRDSGTRAMPMTPFYDDPPSEVVFPRIMVTPFGPVVISQGEVQRRVTPRRTKGAPNHPRITSAGTEDQPADTISELNETIADTGSEISSVAPSLSVVQATQLRDSILSFEPPPSYITELREGRQVGNMRLLTHDDLGRLVDRVTVLRRRGRTLDTIDSGDVNQNLDETGEEDPVELLARRIVESGSGSNRTRLRTDKDIE